MKGTIPRRGKVRKERGNEGYNNKEGKGERE